MAGCCYNKHMRYYQKSATQVMSQFKTTQQGLSRKQIPNLIKKYGPNQVKIKGVPLWKKLIEPFRDVFSIVLLSAAVISLLQQEIIDAIIILAVLVISAIIFYIQRFSTERVLRNLNKQTIEKVTVTRGGKTIILYSPELLPGDIVTLSEGEKVSADMRIISSKNLMVDESVLTGESLPLSKNSHTLKGEKQIYEQSNMLFSGSFIVSGQGKAVVVATGNSTEFGNLANLSDKTEPKSPVQRKIDRLISKIIAIVAALSVITFGLAMLRGLDLAESLRFVIALAVSAVPEGLPIAISVILVLGMRRMAAKNALVQHIRAIETLGVITTIATDKTGTITENRLSIVEAWQSSKSGEINEVIAKSYNRAGNLSDPLDKAMMEHSLKSGHFSDRHTPATEIPFDQNYAMSATIWHSGADSIIYLKGAPEEIIKYSKITKAAQKNALKSLDKFTKNGYRVIGLASLKLPKKPKNLPEILKHELNFIGLVAVADTIRPEASSAIKTAIAAGVSVRMITGDHVETAYQIGKNLGMLSKRDQVFDCRQMNQLDDQTLGKVVDKTRVFARVLPEQKFRLLTILKKHNITAMTGDGVNDVPALSNSHVGIAMGSGSSIAKDASGMILLDNNFKTIVDAMREGRVIIANVRRMLFYLLATNAGEMLTMIGALLIGTRLPLEPVQILWVNLVTDTAMAIPLGLEPAEKDVMKQKPIKPNAPVLGGVMIFRMILIAITLAAVTLISYMLFAEEYGHKYAQTIAFTALIATQWSSALAARSDSDSIFTRLRVANRSLCIGLAISILIQAIVLFGPLGQILHITHVEINHLVSISLIALILPILVSEIHKLWIRRRR